MFFSIYYPDVTLVFVCGCIGLALAGKVDAHSTKICLAGILIWSIFLVALNSHAGNTKGEIAMLLICGAVACVAVFVDELLHEQCAIHLKSDCAISEDRFTINKLSILPNRLPVLMLLIVKRRLISVICYFGLWVSGVLSVVGLSFFCCVDIGYMTADMLRTSMGQPEIADKS